MSQSFSVHATIDGGNISVINQDDLVAHLAIEKDTSSDFSQWFYFCATGIRKTACTFVISNAGETTYPKGWENYTVATSYDRKTWVRTPARFDGKQLSWTIQADADMVWFAYFAPYTFEQHLDLIARVCVSPFVSYECLGTSNQGRSIDYLCITDGKGPGLPKVQLWVIARQHPGESMTEWFMQGFIERLLEGNDATSQSLKALADIHVVPNMNPDGTYLGNLRTNALGVNLNREWLSPDEKKSPEVFHVRNRMRATGVSMALDVHGDEALPYNFIAGTEGIESWTEQRNVELRNVKHTWASLNPDFQTQYGYPVTAKGKANLALCSNYLAHSFDCLAMTLEMPFKDTADNPQPHAGWSPERSIKLGASFVDVAHLTLKKQLLEADGGV